MLGDKMKYTYESQKKALKYLIENLPHDMEKFQNLYNIEIEGVTGLKLRIPIDDILLSGVWSAEEKVQLLKIYEYNKNKARTSFYDDEVDREEDVGSCFGIYGSPLIDKCIKGKSYSGVQALLSLGDHISVATIAHIVKYIDNPGERYKFCKLIVDHYKDKENIIAWHGQDNHKRLVEIPSLCDRYPEYADHLGEKTFWRTVSSMEDICGTNDLELVKLFLPTVKNIKPLFMFAVNSRNVEMVKLFMKSGADVNFQDLEFAYSQGQQPFKTPLKIAIDNNDLKMVRFLHQNGADLNFVDKSGKMQEYINKLGREEFEKETHKYKSQDDRKAYIVWAKPPLEYAITSGAVSIIEAGYDFKFKDNIEKVCNKRLEIVKYLYENGALFEDGQVNYTDLICFSIKSNNFEYTKYFFEEALKNNAKLDFIKIIEFIHNPKEIRNNYSGLIFSKDYKEGASPWFRFCEEYSQKLDKENYHRNVRLMLEKIFSGFVPNPYHFDKYRDVIKDLSKVLPKETLKEIPAVFGVVPENMEEVVNLGYDINFLDDNGNNVIMRYLTQKCPCPSINNFEKLISLGANINYNGKSNALSYAISNLIDYNNKNIRMYAMQDGKLYRPIEEYDREMHDITKRIIDLSNDDIIMSDSVSQMVYQRITPGFSRIVYNDILKALCNRGFKINDDYFAKLITVLDRIDFREDITNSWDYLLNLYNDFDNKAITTNYRFPDIEYADLYKYGTDESNMLLILIDEHLARNFVTSIEQIQDPDKCDKRKYNVITDDFDSLSNLQIAQDALLKEISRYIGHLDYRQIMTLIDNYPLIDTDSLIRNDLLPKAMDVEDMNLCRELIKRGVNIICYDKDGHDVTSRKYTKEQIDKFISLTGEYNPNKECEDLLAEIGCGDQVLSKKLVKVTKNKKS